MPSTMFVPSVNVGPCRFQGLSISLVRPLANRPNSRNSPRPCLGSTSMGDKLWALDFDGVVCDSCGESALSAWKAASRVWPEYMPEASVTARKDEIIEAMRIVRPVVETGYENIIQIRCLLENVSVEEILDNWEGILADCMRKWQLDRAELVELFGTTRDKWMAKDLQSWLAPNKIYDGLPLAINKVIEDEEVYIVTTKQARFTAALLRDMAGIDFPMERIYSTTVSGEPKTGILTMLQEKHPDKTCLFIEDKLSTLDKVCACTDLDHWQLYLASWGYNTPKERERAAQNPRIQVIDLLQFQDLLVDAKISA